METWKAVLPIYNQANISRIDPFFGGIIGVKILVPTGQSKKARSILKHNLTEQDRAKAGRMFPKDLNNVFLLIFLTIIASMVVFVVRSFSSLALP